MIALKTVHNSFTPTKLAFLCIPRLSKKNSTISLCKSDEAAGADSSPPEGDTRQQELLAKIAMLQTQKVRLTDYLDERSAYLTQFAEEANAEFDQIGENAMKELDEAGTRIMENIESRMRSFEESTELSRMENQKKERKLEDFESQIERDRNEGLFFKNLREKSPQEKEAAKEEMKKIKEITKETAGSKSRRRIYLLLMGLLAVGIVNAVNSSLDWQKVAGLGAIWIALLTQFIFLSRLGIIGASGVSKCSKSIQIAGSKIKYAEIQSRKLNQQ